MGGGVKVLLSVLCLLSCSDNEVDGPGRRIHFSIQVGETSTKSAGEVPSTKSILDKDKLQNGGKLHVIGQVSFFYKPEYNNPARQKRKFLDGALIYSSSEKGWVSESGESVYWNDWGDHKFFCWTLQTEGENVTDLFQSYQISSPYSEWVEVYATTMTSESPQIDFLYSDVVTRSLIEDSPSNDYSGITFFMNHLFSAFDIVIKNETGQTLHLKNVKIEGLKNKSGALIKFDGDHTAVEYKDATTDGLFYSKEDTDILISGGTENAPVRYSVFADATGPAENEHHLIWPQEDAYLSFTISYTLGDATEVITKTGSKALTLSPSVKYNMNLAVKDECFSPIEISVEPLPWTSVHADTDLEVQGTSLEISKNDYNVVDNIVTIENDQPVKGKFKVDKPLGGMWTAYLDGDLDYFTLSPSYGTIDGNEVELTITPNTDPSLNRDESHSVRLRFGVVTPNMEFDATDVLNSKNYTITLPYKVQ